MTQPRVPLRLSRVDTQERTCICLRRQGDAGPEIGKETREIKQTPRVRLCVTRHSHGAPPHPARWTSGKRTQERLRGEAERRPADRGSGRAVSTRTEASVQAARRGKQDKALTAGKAELGCHGIPNVCSTLSGPSNMASRSYKSSASQRSVISQT